MLVSTSRKTPRGRHVRDRMEEHDAMASRVCAASSNDILVRSSRDVDPAMTELLLNLLESAIWVPFTSKNEMEKQGERRMWRTNLVCSFTIPCITTNHHSAIASMKARPKFRPSLGVQTRDWIPIVKWTYILCSTTFLGVCSQSRDQRCTKYEVRDTDDYSQVL